MRAGQGGASGRYDILRFFFQAEDGIRDVAVTGVQTCALPISWQGAVVYVVGGTVSFAGARPAKPFEPAKKQWGALELAARIHRSEERRVGKECRSGWLRCD